MIYSGIITTVLECSSQFFLRSSVLIFFHFSVLAVFFCINSLMLGDRYFLWLIHISVCLPWETLPVFNSGCSYYASIVTFSDGSRVSLHLKPRAHMPVTTILNICFCKLKYFFYKGTCWVYLCSFIILWFCLRLQTK